MHFITQRDTRNNGYRWVFKRGKNEEGAGWGQVGEEGVGMNWESGGGGTSQGLPFHDIKEFSLSRQSWISFLLGQKYLVQLRHLRFIRDHSQPVPLEETPDSFWKCFASQLWSPSLFQVLPHPAGTGAPRLPPGYLSAKVVPALQRQTFTTLSGGGTPVQTSSGV